MIYALGTKTVSCAEAAWIAPSAQLIGDVTVHRDASLWFNVVARGDNDPIVIGEESNIQDLTMLHTDAGVPLTIGRRCTVGHRAILHGCTIGDQCLIGMGAIIMNHAVIGANCIIGSHALIPEGKTIPPGSLVVGAPGRVIRPVNDRELAILPLQALHYVENARRFRRDLRPAGA